MMHVCFCWFCNVVWIWIAVSVYIYRSVWKERPQHKAKGGERETTEGIDLLSVCIYKRNHTEGVDPLRERETTEGIDLLRVYIYIFIRESIYKRNHIEGVDPLRERETTEGIDLLREWSNHQGEEKPHRGK